MKSFQIITLSIVLFSITTIGCRRLHNCIEAKGPVITREITIEPFTQVEVQGSIDVFITQGETQQVKVLAHENLIDHVETKVVGGVWYVKLKDACYRGDNVRVDIIVPKISAARINGSGDIDVGPFEDQSNLTLFINGSGEISVNRFTGAKQLNVDINGSGSVQGIGQFTDLEKLQVDVSGSGTYRAYPIAA